jgi:hypothetical protein
MKTIKWLLITIGLVLLCMPLFFSLFWEANKSGDMGIIPEPPEQPKEVAVGGSLSKSVLVVGDTARLWITFRNRSSQSVTKLRVSQLDVPGFDAGSMCWNDGAKNQCTDLAKTEIPLINAEQTVVLWSDLTARNPVERHVCYAVLSWVGIANAPSEIVVPVGGNIIQTLWERRLHAARELMKDFALPLLFVFLGLYVGQWDKAREAARQAHEAETEQTNLTWNSMLPETYKLAVRYYMKIQAALAGVIRDLEKARSAAKTSATDPRTLTMCRSAFFYLVLFERRVKYFLDLNSGFYFKYRTGEDLCIAAHQRYKSLYLGEDEKRRRDLLRVIEAIDLNETLDAFLNKLDGTAGVSPAVTKDFNDGWSYFLLWVSSPECQAALLELKTLEFVLGFELNRPYAYWYGWTETSRYWKEVEKNLRETAVELEKIPDEKPIAILIETYLAGGTPARPFTESSE